MLRFAVISLSTLVVLGALFFVLVWQGQPAAENKVDPQSLATPTQLSSTQSSSGVGPGKKVWLDSYDKGKLSSQFTADEFTPQKDGSFFVLNPIAVFYMDNGQYMLVKGDNAVVNCDTPAPGQSKGMFAASAGPPRNGFLHKVRIELYPSKMAVHPTLWMETDNIHFDNDTLRMYTENFTNASGNTIAADRVPVTARGDDYEFDGKGLTLWWNGIDHRLQMLRVNHGERLVIKNPSKLSLPGMTKPDAVSKPVAMNRQQVQHGNVSLVAMNTTPTAKSPPKTVTPYRAVFNDDVRILQIEHLTGTADTMTIDFLQGASKPASAAPVAPAAPPASADTEVPLAARQAAEGVTTQPAGPLISITPQPATSPVDKQTRGPITILWTGKLEIKPLETPPLMPLLPGQSVVQLLGSPAKLTPEGSELDAASATYRSPDGAVRLENSATQPDVTMKQINAKTNAVGLTLKTQSLVYDPATSLATILGPSELHVPASDHQQAMDVTWTKTGQLHMPRLPGEQQPRRVDHVDLIGDVAVNHPQFNLDSRELQLDLDLVPRAANSKDIDEQLKKLTAIDAVKCKLIHPAKPTQGINSDQLVINMAVAPDKKTVPREVLANGNVVAFVNDLLAANNQGDAAPAQQLTAGHLQALLLAKAASPATKPSADDVATGAELESLHAWDDVHASMKGGASAAADDLRVTTVDTKQIIELSGQNAAVLNNGKGSFLSGSIVHVTSDHNGVAVVSVDGAGKLETVRAPASTTQPTNAAPPKPIDITWTDSMSLNEMTNLGDVMGHVIVTDADSAGNNSVITGDNAHLDLMDAPKTSRKSTAPDAAASTAVMGNKQLKKLTLSGNVHGATDLIGPDGALIRHGDLYGNQLIYTAGTGADEGTAEVPGAGKMFMENHRPDPKEGGNSRGALAISWQKDLTYDQASDRITIQGDTATGFEQEAKPAKDGSVKPAAPMLLNADTLVITLAKAATTAPTTQPANRMQLSDVTASGQVVFRAQTLELTCATVDYDPKTGLLTAAGTPQRPGQTRDANHSVIGSFDSLVYDTVNQQVVSVERLQGQLQK